MLADAEFKRDSDYFELYYTEWYRHRARYRRFVFPVLIALILLSIVAFLFLTAKSLIPWGLAAIGGVEMVDGLTHKFIWMRARRKEAASKVVSIRFTDFGIEFNTDKFHGAIGYDDFLGFYVTPNGLFLCPIKRSSIFVPLAAISPKDALPEIQQRFTVVMSRINCNTIWMQGFPQAFDSRVVGEDVR